MLLFAAAAAAEGQINGIYWENAAAVAAHTVHAVNWIDSVDGAYWTLLRLTLRYSKEEEEEETNEADCLFIDDDDSPNDGLLFTAAFLLVDRVID